MNDYVVWSGVILAVFGGLTLFTASSMADNMDWVDIANDPGRHDMLGTISDVGIIVCILGIIFFVLGFALPDLNQKRVQTQYQYAGISVPKLCAFCGTPLNAALRCPGCGRVMPTWDKAKEAWVFAPQVREETESAGQHALCAYCGQPTDGKPFCAYCGKKVEGI